MLSQDQVYGINGILDAFITHGDGSNKTLAYALATAYHETGSRMSPVREGFAKDDATARRIVSKRKYGVPTGPYRHVYYGRGQVQLTWEENYKTSSKDAGVDLVANPDKMLDPVISARVLICGLVDGRWNGKGKGISYYLPHDGVDDLKNARRTVNILDKWDLIAGYYTKFYQAIKDAGDVPVAERLVVDDPGPKPGVVVAKPPPAPVGKHWIAAAIEAIIKAFGTRT